MRKSAGILLYRFDSAGGLEMLLVHPGGPFWKSKDSAVWTIPKGEFDDTEEPLAAAVREFKEETGTLLSGDFLALTPIKQKAGKLVYAWALEGTLDAANILSNTFKMEWPPRSGKWQQFAEVDKAAWFDISEAKEKINPAQVSFLGELESLLADK